MPQKREQFSSALFVNRCSPLTAAPSGYRPRSCILRVCRPPTVALLVGPVRTPILIRSFSHVEQSGQYVSVNIAC